MTVARVVGSLILFAAASSVLAEEKFEGFLCCNMRTDGEWISDINYEEEGKSIIPAGTPVKVTGYGRHRVYIDVNGQEQAIGNDYSRDIELVDFAHRYVVQKDPKSTIASFPKAIQAAITSSKIAKGMTREQVLMSVGYPVASENPTLESNVWKFWLDSFSEYHVIFDDKNRVADVEAEPEIRVRVVAE